jgi:methylated-DNA-[protein]-cysteine S-methyltransferase
MSIGQNAAALTLFSTSIGRCGIAWEGEKIRATHLPENSDADTMARLALRTGAAGQGDPPPAVKRAIAAMTALLSGERIDLSFIDCDFSGLEAFNVRVYQAARAIPPGETLTYGEIAIRLGEKRWAQAVGQALGRNPFPIIVPCHRVLGAKGRLTGFSANGGIETKLRMLAIEGAPMGQSPALFGDLPFAMKPARPR